MQKIAISICALIISSQVFAQSSGINEATKLISESKLDEALPVLNKIITNKNESASARVKALRLLVSYPIGTFAYSNRYTSAKKIIDDEKFFSLLKLEDKIFILRTGGLGAFQAAEWNTANILLDQILELSKSNPKEFKINSPHHDDLAVTIEYLGWIKLNKKEFSQLIKYWVKELQTRELSPLWKEAILRDLGQATGEMLFEATEAEFAMALEDLEKFTQRLSANELLKFKTGFKLGIDRSNYEDKRYASILKRINRSESLIKITQETILEDEKFADIRPCFIFELASDKNQIKKDFNKQLEAKTLLCWQIKKSITSLKNDSAAPGLLVSVNKLGLELVQAEVAEKNGQFYESCLLALKLNEVQMAIRTCIQDLASTNTNNPHSDEIRKVLTAKTDQSPWIGVWDILFNSINDPQKKSEWLKSYYPTPESAFALVKDKNENRPLIWWFEDSMNKVSKQEALDSKWSEEFLKIESPIWKMLNLSDDNKYQAILSISIITQNHTPIIDNISKIESAIKPKSNLEKFYTAWLNQYMSNNKETLVVAPAINSKYYLLWQSSLIFIKKIKNLDSEDLAKWNKTNQKKSSLYPAYIPGIANLFNQSAASFLKTDTMKLNLKSDRFARNLNKIMKLLNASIKNLQMISQTDFSFSSDTEELRKEFIKRILIRIQDIQTPSDWKKEEQDFWTSEKEKILQALGGQL